MNQLKKAVAVRVDSKSISSEDLSLLVKDYNNKYLGYGMVRLESSGHMVVVSARYSDEKDSDLVATMIKNIAEDVLKEVLEITK